MKKLLIATEIDDKISIDSIDCPQLKDAVIAYMEQESSKQGVHAEEMTEDEYEDIMDEIEDVKDELEDIDTEDIDDEVEDVKDELSDITDELEDEEQIEDEQEMNEEEDIQSSLIASLQKVGKHLDRMAMDSSQRKKVLKSFEGLLDSIKTLNKGEK